MKVVFKDGKLVVNDADLVSFSIVCSCLDAAGAVRPSVFGCSCAPCTLLVLQGFCFRCAYLIMLVVIQEAVQREVTLGLRGS